MKTLADIIGVLGVISLILGVIFALVGTQVLVAPHSWLDMALTLFVLSIAIVVVKPFTKKKEE